MRVLSQSRRRGSTLLEAVLFLPFLVMLLLGLVEFGRITYTYYALQKAMYNFARFASTQQAINFCDTGDVALTRARSVTITGTSDDSADPLIAGLEASNLRIRIERYEASSDSLVECDCSSNGCDTGQGGGAPGWVTVDLENGYPVTLRLLGLNPDPILLRPSVRVPFGGT